MFQFKFGHSKKTESEVLFEALLEKLRDPLYLFSFEEIVEPFRLVPNLWQRLRMWGQFVSHFDTKRTAVYVIPAKEFIADFAAYLSRRADELGKDTELPLTVVEVGAGNGKLAYYLRRHCEEFFPDKIILRATDTGHYGIKPLAPVEVMDYRETLQKYQPTIVIAAWMSHDGEWTSDFRATASLQEYILLGETEGGWCGDDWLTWGADFRGDEVDDAEARIKAPYLKEGFYRLNLGGVSKHLLGISDVLGHLHRSRAVSFRRKKHS